MAVNIKSASKSKTPLIIGAMIVLVLLLGGVYFMKFKGGSSVMTGGGIVGNLKDAIMAGQSMKCTYTSDEGQTTIYTKGDKVRMEGAGFGGPESGQGSGGMISDGSYTYMWSDVDKQGMKFKIEEAKADTSDARGQIDQSDSSVNRGDFADMKRWAEETSDKFDVKCTPFNVTDSMFVPPADIVWQDMEEFQRQMQDMTNKLESEGYDSQGLEKLMKQIPEGMEQ